MVEEEEEDENLRLEEEECYNQEGRQAEVEERKKDAGEDKNICFHWGNNMLIGGV